MASTSPFPVEHFRDRLMAGVLAWLGANLAFFDPPQEDTLLDATPESILPGPKRKAFGELGLALRLCHRVPAIRAHADVRRLTSAWLAAAHDRKIYFDARRRVHLAPLLAVALAVQAELDTVDETAKRALQTVLDRGFLDRTERSAWGQIDIAYYLDVVGLRHTFPDSATAFRRSSLLQLPTLPHALRLDLYAVTHLVFHLTDFGARRIAGATDAELASVVDYLALALVTCIAERDWDLVGECVAARACLGVGPDVLNEAAIERLTLAQQPAGFVPDLSWLRGLDPTGASDDAAAAEFAAVYHPTLVALIMLACDAANVGRRALA